MKIIEIPLPVMVLLLSLQILWFIERWPAELNVFVIFFFFSANLENIVVKAYKFVIHVLVIKF